VTQTHPLKSLYAKISLIFLALLLALGAMQAVLTYRVAMDVVRETDQTLNRSLAHDLAQDLSPHLEGPDIEGIAHRIHQLMVINPHVEIYVLDDEGRPLAYFPEYKVLERETIDTATLDVFIDGEGDLALPFAGDDPRQDDGKKPFSAARVDFGDGETGYLYVILGGDRTDSVRSMLEESAILRAGGLAIGGAFLVTAVVGLVLFAVLTRRLGNLTSLVEEFRAGKLGRRARVTRGDEIGQLASAFNEMADTIQGNVRQLEETDRLRRELIANVSHDLRSPLASMRGYLETIELREQNLSPEDRARHLRTILNNVVSLSKLVEELFELSKLDAKQTLPDPEPFSIAELVQDVAVAHQPQAEERGIALRTEVAPGMPTVVADIAMIERVVSNLIENAIRYTDSGGEVAIAIERRGEEVDVHVSDTGCGIPPEDVPHVFDRFYRVEKSRSRESGGAGLGLAIVKKIIEAHDGVITVTSELEKGTTFAFRLPVHVPS